MVHTAAAASTPDNRRTLRLRRSAIQAMQIAPTVPANRNIDVTRLASLSVRPLSSSNDGNQLIMKYSRIKLTKNVDQISNVGRA
ncbi:hypothetical protein D3C80_2073410 [compost metagenome]